MNKIGLAFLAIFLLASCSQKQTKNATDRIITKGQMPDIAKEKDDKLHLVFGTGDSIMYAYSSDHGYSFSKPELIAVLSGVYAFATRGPQVAVTDKSIVVTAATSKGDIFSFYKTNGGKWTQGQRVNDIDTVAKEGLTALSADGENAFAVWLDLRGNKKNKIYGAASTDGGKTWSANKMIYTSPDTTVCECCKPSVVVKGSNVFVMFRNWLNGNRDMYVIKSVDGGATFGKAQKLGEGSWKLNGCPMDGGGLSVNEKGEVQTVWRRHGKIYFAAPGEPEKAIGTGKGCTIETAENKNFYAWTENGKIVLTDAQGKKKIIGEGSGPVLKALNDQQVLCVWENEKEIHGAVVEL